MRKKSILILGYFGFYSNQLDGQTIKTRNVYDLIKSNENLVGEVKYFDTEIFKKNRLTFLTLIWELVNSKVLIYLPAQNNLKFIFPFIYSISVVFKIEIYYLVVGGWLPKFIANKPLHRLMLKRIAGIYTETKLMNNELEQLYHFRNVDTFPNFRSFNFKPFPHNEDTKLNLVFMARINKMKGLDMIFKLGDYIQNYGYEKHIDITFFGPILDENRSYFETELAKFSFMKYRGELQPAEIYSTLQHFDVLLLPTHYYTEGFPGSILDAYISGIPVIVTKWKYAEEFVENGKTGYIVPFENGESVFFNSVIKLLNDKELLQNMKHTAHIKAKEFSTDKAWSILKPYLIN